jgi:S-adenosylmethionine:tRNA ribosyltransferase-isomerase
MDSEEMVVEEAATMIINGAKENRKKIISVGTTTMKALETAVTISGKVKPYRGWTNKFIFPPYDFSVADALVTNFHLPMSSMMMMAAAFSGYDFLMEAYREAIDKKYKFFTYGDAMLIV